MKTLITSVLISLAPVALFADESDDDAVRECLSKWEKHPFNEKTLKYRTIASKVKVMGGGSIDDNRSTPGPELILVKPAVAVMAKTVYHLNNPKGWYCIAGRVSVMGKIQINLACSAKLASSADGVAVGGASDEDSGGVAVFGSTRIKRNCEPKSETKD